MLQELNHESLLLLYLTDELSASERARVQTMLETDAGLRTKLSRLDASIQSFEDGMARLDAMPLSSESAGVRQIGQMMRGRMAEQLARTVPATVAKPKLGYPWWAYPSVAAAVVLITFVSWWGNRPEGPMKMPSQIGSTQTQTMPAEEATQLAESIKNNFRATNLAQPEQSVASLDAAEDGIAELSRSQSRIIGSSDGNE